MIIDLGWFLKQRVQKRFLLNIINLKLINILTKRHYIKIRKYIGSSDCIIISYKIYS